MREYEREKLGGASPENFRLAVYEMVAKIPKGRVMTYGQIAALCGSPRAARIVGGIAHFGPDNLPWQRVVKQSGSLAEGYPGGQQGHAQALQAEGIVVSPELQIDVNKHIWWPHE